MKWARNGKPLLHIYIYIYIYIYIWDILCNISHRYWQDMSAKITSSFGAPLLFYIGERSGLGVYQWKRYERPVLSVRMCKCKCAVVRYHHLHSALPSHYRQILSVWVVEVCQFSLIMKKNISFKKQVIMLYGIYSLKNYHCRIINSTIILRLKLFKLAHGSFI